MLVTKKIYTILKKTQKEGKLSARPLLEEPTTTEVMGYYEKGQLHFRYTIDQKGRLNGVGRMYFDNGTLEREDPFHKGVLHGRQRIFFATGKLKAEANYTNNHFDGTRRECYPSGKTMMECNYAMNHLEGPSFEWHPNGQIKERGHYFEGRRHGIFKEYDDKGKIISKELFILGVRYTGKLRRLVQSEKITPKRICKIQSTAVRRILLEEIGYERFASSMPSTVLDQEDDQELIKIEWHKDEEPLYLVKVKCPSTSAFYTLRVSPQVKTVREAVAWTFSLTEANYTPQEET